MKWKEMNYLSRRVRNIVFLNIVNLTDETSSALDINVYGDISNTELFSSYLQQALKKAINEYVEIESKITNMDSFLS